MQKYNWRGKRRNTICGWEKLLLLDGRDGFVPRSTVRRLPELSEQVVPINFLSSTLSEHSNSRYFGVF